MLENLTELLLPALLLLAGAAGIAKKQDVYDGMLAGAQDGLRLMFSLIPTLILMLTAAEASLLTLIAMLIPNRAASAVVSILAMLGLVAIGAIIYNALCEPEFASSAILTANGIEISDPSPNPYYISGTLRKIYQFLVDALPGGQAVLLANQELMHPIFSLCASFEIVLITSIAGIVCFKRKNLK